MPSYLDLGLIGVILVSALLAMLRGFTREVLAIASWGAAALAALYFHPLVLPYLKPYISKDTIALAAAGGLYRFAGLRNHRPRARSGPDADRQNAAQLSRHLHRLLGHGAQAVC